MKSKKQIATIMAATMLASTVNVVAAQEKTTSESLIGKDRNETAIKISKEGWKSAETVILVNDSAIPDALTATPLAFDKNAPILLTSKKGLNKETKAEIERLGAKNVVLIGGNAVLPQNIEKELKSLNLKTDRIKGDTREETALEIAKRLDKSSDVSEIAVVNGITGLADAVSVASAAATRHMPIILANPKKGLSASEKFIKDEAIKSSYVIGGDKAISDKIISKLPYAERIEGKDRNDTNAKVIGRFYEKKSLNNMYLAKDGRGGDSQLIDALAVGALAAKNNSPVLIASKSLSQEQIEIINSKKVNNIVQVGGKGNENAFEQLKEIEKVVTFEVKNEKELEEVLKKANANDVIVLNPDSTVNDYLYIYTEKAIELQLKGNYTEKILLSTPNADIVNSGTISVLEVEDSLNTTITNTSSGKIENMIIARNSQDVVINNKGTITKVENNGEDTKINNNGTITKPIIGETPEIEGNKPGESTSGGGGSSSGGGTIIIDNTKENIVQLTKDATSYKYTDASKYEYTGKINVTGTTTSEVLFEGNYESINLGDDDSKKAAMDDMARYLGALYRTDNGEKIKAIKYNNKEYKWNEKGTLKGSNWQENGNGKTLVKQIVEDFRGESPTNKVNESIKLNLVAENGKEVVMNINFESTYEADAEVNGKRYKTLVGAINSANEVGLNSCTIKILRDININNTIPILNKGEIIIDLNKNKITSSTKEDSFESVREGQTLTIKNGTLNLNVEKVNESCIYVENGGILNLKDIEYNAKGTGVFLLGKGSTANIERSKMNTSGYCITTNAGNIKNGGIIYNVKESVLTSSGEGSPGVPILVNVPCQLNIDKCDIQGHFQGIIVRGGDAMISDTTITNTVDNETKYQNYFDNRNWGSGNAVNLSALTIGNKSPKSYQYPSNVKLNNVVVKDGNKDNPYPAIYMWGNDGEGLGATLTYDENCKIEGDIILGNDKCSINGENGPLNNKIN